MAAQIDFKRFWNYYRATARTVDYSGYSEKFFWAFSKALEDLQLKDWRYPGNWPTVDTIAKNLTKICTKVRTKMLSNGIPATAVTNILDRFKKWFREYYF